MTFNRWVTVISLAVVASRIPLLPLGYSHDGDAWRVAVVGKQLWTTGSYEASRMPGFPLHEIITGPCALLGGAPASNAATLGITVILLVIWAYICRRESRHPILLTALLAFTPLLLTGAASTLDYNWSLACLLGSFVYLRRHRTLPAGLLLGLASGFRPTNLVAILPLSLLLQRQGASRREVAVFCSTALMGTLVCFLPVILTYGPAGWVASTRMETRDVMLALDERILLFAYRLTYSIGPLALLLIAVCGARYRRQVFDVLRSGEPVFPAALAACGVFLGVFLFFPLERAYLLPAVPFLYLAVDRLASTRTMVLLLACVLGFGFVNPDVVSHRIPRGIPGFNIHWGPLVEEWQKRNRVLEERTRIASLPLLGKAVVMTSAEEVFWHENNFVEETVVTLPMLPRIRAVRSKANPTLYFVSVLTRSEVQQVRALGFDLYCLDYVGQFILHHYGYDPFTFGAKSIPTSPP